MGNLEDMEALRVILVNRVVRVGLIEKVILEQRLESKVRAR